MRDRDAFRAILAAYGVSEAGVFGSVARREDSPFSDLDLIVRFDDGKPRDLVGLSDALSRLTGLQVDVVDHEAVFARAQSTGIGQTILRDTIPL